MRRLREQNLTAAPFDGLLRLARWLGLPMPRSVTRRWLVLAILREERRIVRAPRDQRHDVAPAGPPGRK